MKKKNKEKEKKTTFPEQPVQVKLGDVIMGNIAKEAEQVIMLEKINGLVFIWPTVLPIFCL